LIYYHLVDTIAGGLFVLVAIIHPVVSVSTLMWFIIYIYWEHFLNHVIIIKTKVILA